MKYLFKFIIGFLCKLYIACGLLFKENKVYKGVLYRCKNFNIMKKKRVESLLCRI